MAVGKRGSFTRSSCARLEMSSKVVREHREERRVIRYPKALFNLMTLFQKLPGIGGRSAERFVFHLLNWEERDLHAFASCLSTIPRSIHPCKQCRCLMEGGECHFCHQPNRDAKVLCIVASPRDVYSIENTRCFRGLYHVFGTLFSPTDQATTHSSAVAFLEKRIMAHSFQEVIIAFDSTMEGDTTALFLRDHFHSHPFIISRLAFGLPIGSSLEFVDSGTLSQAFTGRHRA